ncbi:MAG: carboxylating nicotinate-nucleotide diphosphorylase [Bdellovibrionales bacterium]|nr:carboxylating nicotinate-nucleotide diphosphorylase [Bdellovibrionales bacterium]
MAANPRPDQGDTAPWGPLLRRGLEEDNWAQDWTTLGALATDPTRISRARWVAKAQGIWCSAGLMTHVERVASELGVSVNAKALVADGTAVRPGTVLAAWDGQARILLAMERPALNLAQYACGIATATRALVSAVEESARGRGCPPPRVAATRKSLPFYRDLALLAVRSGGGHPHRVNLAGGVLIKENHVAAAGGIPEAIAGARGVAPHGLRVEVEVRSAAEAESALLAGADAILLDNFAPADAIAAARAAKSRAPGIVVEVSGGIDAASIGAYVDASIDVISSGALTHSVRALDISMLMEGA